MAAVNKLIVVPVTELKRGDVPHGSVGYWTVEGTTNHYHTTLVHLRSSYGSGHTSDYKTTDTVKVWRVEPFTDEEIKDLFMFEAEFELLADYTYEEWQPGDVQYFRDGSPALDPED